MQYFQAVQIGKKRANKAQTKALEKEEAQKIFNKVLASGIAEFPNKEIKIWTDTYPTVQDELK